MQTIYQDDAFSIKTYHNIPEDDIEQQNIDFWLIIGDKTFLGSAFTGESAFGTYFWASDMIILKEMTVECLVKAIRNILNDQSLNIGEIFTQVANNP